MGEGTSGMAVPSSLHSPPAECLELPTVQPHMDELEKLMRGLSRLATQASECTTPDDAALNPSWVRTHAALAELEPDSERRRGIQAAVRTRHAEALAFTVWKDTPPREGLDGREGPLWEAERELDGALAAAPSVPPGPEAAKWQGGDARAHSPTQGAQAPVGRTSSVGALPRGAARVPGSTSSRRRATARVHGLPRVGRLGNGAGGGGARASGARPVRGRARRGATAHPPPGQQGLPSSAERDGSGRGTAHSVPCDGPIANVGHVSLRRGGGARTRGAGSRPRRRSPGSGRASQRATRAQG